jgi:hypothetical protein
MNKNFIFLIFLIFSLAKNAIASEIEIKLICKNETDTEEFILRSDSKQTLKNVFKNYKGKFIPIGEVVGFKNKSFILFEDKYKYLGVDFAWHLDNNTMELKPVVLSESTIRLNKIPKKLFCNKY